MVRKRKYQEESESLKKQGSSLSWKHIQSARVRVRTIRRRWQVSRKIISTKGSARRAIRRWMRR
eukprot:7054728-Karenia_brevis.AAC.1